MEKTCTITLEDCTQVEVVVHYEYYETPVYTDSYLLDEVATDEFYIVSITNAEYQDIIDAEYDEFKNEVESQIKQT